MRNFAAVIAALAFFGAYAPARSAATQQFIGSPAPLLDAASGKTIGSLAPGTAVDVAGQSGAATEVTVRGWSARGSKALVFSSPSKHVTELSAFTGQSVTGASQTVGSTIYDAVTVVGWVTTSVLVPNVQIVWTSVAALYADKCAACHALKSPAVYSAADWPAFLTTHAANAALDPAQTALITAYLQTQSGK